MLVELCKSLGELALAAGLNGFCKDRAGILVLEIHDVLGAADGGVREITGLVVENSAGNGHCFGEHTLGFEVGIGTDGRRCHDLWWRNGG